MYEHLNQAFETLNLVGEHDKRNRRSGVFETRRAHIGRAYHISGEIRRLSKEFVAALLDRVETAELDEIEQEMRTHMRSLVELDLPDDIAWQHQAEAGQEYVEARFTRILFKNVVEGEKLPETLPLPADFLVSEPCWLAGIGDSVTEMSKLITDVLLNEEMSRADRLCIRKRFVSVAQDIYDALDKFETVLPAVINNNRRRGYFNTYRGMLGRIRGAIGYHKEKIADILDDKK
jgi:predicted translin family RNA/ssDNA-binding protein